MTKHLADLSGVSRYEVRIEFTNPMQPREISTGQIPLVSVALEIKANSLTNDAAIIRKQYGRIPYGAPLYWWEAIRSGKNRCVYIGQTVMLPLQKRFEGHAKLVRLLCRYVNNPNVSVVFRLCSRLDISYSLGNVQYTRAIEHLPLDQAQKVVDDIEAHLIYTHKPEFNNHHKKKPKVPWKQFDIKQFTLK